MTREYIKLLAAILWKAQGYIDAETGDYIDVGEEVQRLRNLCDRLQVDSETLKHFEQMQVPRRLVYPSDRDSRATRYDEGFKAGWNACRAKMLASED